MSDIKHTPGPWEWSNSSYYGFTSLWNPQTRQEVLVPGGRNDGDDPIVWMGEEMSDADRALIAAAPDLLEALKGLLHAYSMGPLDCAALYGPDADLRQIERNATARANDAIEKASIAGVKS